MAGYGKLRQDTREPLREDQKKWVKPAWLVETGQPFCILTQQQDHADQRGNPQLTVYINYVSEGMYCERQFDLAAYDWRMRNAREMEKAGYPFHHMRLVRVHSKKEGGAAYLDFEDVEPQPEDCACNGYGVIDPRDESTWTDHYRLSRQLNDFLIRTGQQGLNEHFDTADMTVEQVQRMLTMVGVLPHEK